MKFKIANYLIGMACIAATVTSQADYAGCILKESVKQGMDLKDQQVLKAAGYSPLNLTFFRPL